MVTLLLVHPSRESPTRRQQQRQHDASRASSPASRWNSRALEHRFSEGRVREDLAAGRITVSDLQRQADELRARWRKPQRRRRWSDPADTPPCFKCGACGTMQYPKPGGLCPGCGEAMRR